MPVYYRGTFLSPFLLNVGTFLQNVKSMADCANVPVTEPIIFNPLLVGRIL